MWQFPWRYKESIAITGGIIIVGFVLQFTIGAFDFTLLRWPVNIILGGIIVLFLLLLSCKRKSLFYQWLSGVPLAVTLISSLVILGVIMGLTPQVVSDSTANDLLSRLGFHRMTSSWPFILVYFLILLSLGALIIRRIRGCVKIQGQTSLRAIAKQSLCKTIDCFVLVARPRNDETLADCFVVPPRNDGVTHPLFNSLQKDYAFYLNHIGLWLLLFAAGFGASDIRRYVMHVHEGETEWRVYNEKNDILDPPIAIELNDFYMEEYPPKLTIINRETGASQPENNPEYFQIDEKQRNGKIDGWEIFLEEYIHEAVRNSDSTYREVHMPGASPAAKVEIRNLKTNTRNEGWICAGNISQLYMVLNIDEQYCVAMTRPEPKRFVSDINVYTEDGKIGHTLLEVNKPYKLGNWMLYQYGYDNDAGNMSAYSSIELVYDPWVIPVYIGIILLACGSICMLWSGNKEGGGDDLE